MKKLLNKKGFTLIELIVVIAILAILALILIPSILNYVDEANKSKDLANARALYSEVVLNVTTNGTVTATNVPSGCEVYGSTQTDIVVKCNAAVVPEGSTTSGTPTLTANP